MKSIINKYIPIVLILTGCFLILLPKINRDYYEKKQKILDEVVEETKEDNQSNIIYNGENEISQKESTNKNSNIEGNITFRNS